MTRTILDSGINWNWYFCGDFNEDNKTVIVYCYDRFHKYDQMQHPIAENVRWFQLIETKERRLTGVRINDTIYEVVNQGYVFSYRDDSRYSF